MPDPLYGTREAFIKALADDVELIAVEEIPGCGRSLRHGARKIGESFARQAITPAAWEEHLKGNAQAQEALAVTFLKAARAALLAELESKSAR